MTNLKINTCPQTMYITPVIEDEIEKVVKILKRQVHQGLMG